MITNRYIISFFRGSSILGLVEVNEYKVCDIFWNDGSSESNIGESLLDRLFEKDQGSISEQEALFWKLKHGDGK